jgi:hypothetical protein
VRLLFDDPMNQTPGIAHTWYAATQSVFEYVDHKMEYTKKDRAVEALFGRGAQIKAKALSLAESRARKR